MKIGFVVTHPSRGSAGTFERMHEILKHLNKENFETTLITPFSKDVDYVTDIDMQLIPNTLSKMGISSLAYKILRRISSSSISSGLFLSQISIDKMVNSIKPGLEKILTEKKFDILHAVQPIAGLACGPLAKKFNIPLIIEMNNIWPEETVAQNLIKRGDETFERLKAIEQQNIDSSDMVNVISDQMKSYLTKNYIIDEKKIIVVPSAGPVFSDVNNTNRENNVIYAGSVNPRAQVEIFVNSIPFVKQPTKFSISNTGDAINKIKKITSQEGFPKVNFFWFQQRNELLDFLKRAKIGIATFHDDITWKLGIPLKPFDYLACGLPVVINDVGNWWSDVIQKEDVGIVTSNKPHEFAQAIDTILNDDTTWQKMHTNAINLIKTKYNWEKIVRGTLIPTYKEWIKN